MSIDEATKAATEIILTAEDMEEVKHAAEVKKALVDLDLDKLQELQEEVNEDRN